MFGIGPQHHAWFRGDVQCLSCGYDDDRSVITRFNEFLSTIFPPEGKMTDRENLLIWVIKHGVFEGLFFVQVNLRRTHRERIPTGAGGAARSYHFYFYGAY